MFDESRVAQELPYVREDGTPSSTAATMVAKLSSAGTMSAASLETSVPVMLHRYADVGSLQSRRVVNAVSVIATVAPLRCRALTIRQLCPGLTRVDRHFLNCPLQRLFVIVLQFRTRDGLPVSTMPSSSAMTAAVRMIASNHYRANARSPGAQLPSSLLARRINMPINP